MKNKRLLWELYNNSKSWSVRPSTLVGIDPIKDDYRAYCIDQVVAYWGNYVMGELDSIKGKDEKSISRKRHQRLMKLMDAPDEQRFRSVSMARKEPVTDKTKK